MKTHFSKQSLWKAKMPRKKSYVSTKTHWERHKTWLCSEPCPMKSLRTHRQLRGLMKELVTEGMESDFSLAPRLAERS